MRDFPTVQAQLWDRLRNTNYEDLYTKSDLELSEALQLLDYSAYFDLQKEPIPSDINGIAHYLLEDGIIARQDNGLYSITNLGGILFSKQMKDFPRLSRKAVRVVQYEGNNKLSMIRQDTKQKGYGTGFEELKEYIEALLPSREIIQGAYLVKQTVYPTDSIREAFSKRAYPSGFFSNRNRSCS